MLSFPTASELRKRIPKKVLYEKLPLTPALKRCIVEQIKAVTWSHKLTADTLHVSLGQAVDELQVFEISLTSRELNGELLRLMESMIPYHILFLLEHGDRYQAHISFYWKPSDGKVKIRSCFHSHGWQALENLPCRLTGLSLDSVYENLVRQLAGDVLRNDLPLAQAVGEMDRLRKLSTKIATLQRKIAREKQPHRKRELHKQLSTLKSQL